VVATLNLPEHVAAMCDTYVVHLTDCLLSYMEVLG